MKSAICVTAYEHRTINIGYQGLTREHLDALEQLRSREGASWFTLVHRGLRLTEHVGIVQVNGLTLEILPKLDDPERTSRADGETARWRNVLLQMLRYVFDMPIAVPDVATLSTRPQAMLDLFIQAFVQEAEALLRAGLVKTYHPTESNRTALKGRLLFQQQIIHNLVRRERFFTRQQVYDQAHPFNSLLRQALQVAAIVAQGAQLAARARTVLLHWPELPNVPIPTDFPVLTRKTERYHKALQLALLLLKAQSPNLQGGATHAVALLFDMNVLFEAFVARQLQRAANDKGSWVQIQNQRTFWSGVRIRPDLVVRLTQVDKTDAIFILDTKWKVPNNKRPAAADLQQLYAYCHLWKAGHGVLLYPSASSDQYKHGKPYSASLWAPDVQVTGNTLFANILDSHGSLNKQLGKGIIGYLQELA